MKVVVLAGGLSPERDVSLSSASLIANALLEKGHSVFVLDLFLGYKHNIAEFSFVNPHSGNKFNYDVSPTEPDIDKLRSENPDIIGHIGPSVLDICKLADIVFIALHGSVGENGQIQAFFDLHGIHYTGTGYIGCLLAMDKDLSKKLAVTAGLTTAKWSVIDLTREDSSVYSPIGYPCVVKPLSCGSSVGISMVETEEEFILSVSQASKYEKQVLVEQKIIGREFSCGILDGVALPVIEIIPKHGFYDYTNKYQSGMADEVCPAKIDETIVLKIQNITKTIHDSLRLGFYSRSDFIVNSSDEIYYLESNTLPGMTPTSLLPQEARAFGISYSELCDKIVNAKVSTF